MKYKAIQFIQILTPLLLCNAHPIATAQELVSDIVLKGDWSISGSKSQETIKFVGQSDFMYTYVLPKKDVRDKSTMKRESEGAYKLAVGACSAGSEKGNLWIVRQSDRCCFSAYMMGKTLVLDAISGPIVPRHDGLCSSKTLKREDGSLPKAR